MSRSFRLACASVIAVLSCGSGARSAFADSGPYCGIYAIYGAASAVGVSCDFGELLHPKFVSGRSGSSIADLVHAAEHIGVHATPFGGLGVSSLKESRDPLVLHVTSLGQLDTYNHWILFLGMQDGMARTIDAQGDVFLMNVAELLARWDGVALAVSRDEDPATNYGSIELASLTARGLIVISVIGLSAVVLRKRFGALIDRGRIWFSVVPALTVILALFCGLQGDLNLYRNPNCVQFILAAEGHRNFPVLSTMELQTLMGSQSDLVLFDTRYDGDMAYGHIPGALPLPVNLSQHEVSQRVGDIDRDRTVVLYCQSMGCHFSDHMAVVLTAFGFRDIRIYREGWVGWKTARSAAAAVP